MIGTIFIAFLGLFALYGHTKYERARNDRLFQHATLTPISRAELQNYNPIYNTHATTDSLRNTVRDIYFTAQKSAANRNFGYWHTIDELFVNPHLVINHLEPLFPNCTMEYNPRLNAIGVFWHKEHDNILNTSFVSEAL